MLRTPTLRAATGRFSILVFRDASFVRAVGVIKRRLTVGSGALCDISLEDADLPAVWGTIADRGAEVVLEPEDRGPRRAFPFHEAVTIGAFTLVRVAAGTDLPRAIAEIEARLRAERASAPAPTDSPTSLVVSFEDHEAPPEEWLEPLPPEPAPEALQVDRDGPAPLERPPESHPPISVPPPPPPVPRLTGAAAASADDVRRHAEPKKELAREESKQKAGEKTGRTGAAPETARKRVAAEQTASFGPPPAPVQAAARAPTGMPKPSAQAVPMARPAPAPMQMPVPQASRSKGAGPGTLVAAAAGVALGAVGGVAALASAALKADLAADAEGGAGAAQAIARRTTVRHYTQMNPGRTYPLLVIISAGKVERVVMEEVAQVESDVAFTVTRESPTVRIEPVLPGCAVAPTSIEIDCTADLAEARFHVTPIVEGIVPEARIEVRHEGKLVDSVPVPTRVAKQTVAKMSAGFSAVTPFAMQVLRLADHGNVDRADLAGSALGKVHDLAVWAGGPTKLGLLIAVLGALIAFVAYMRNRSKEGSPIVRFLDYSAQMGSAEDLAVERLKAVLVVFTDGTPQVVEIRKRRLTIGGDPSCDVIVKHRAVAGRHAEIRIEGGRMTITALGGSPMSLRFGGATGEIDLAGKDEVAFLLGTLPCLYLREVRSDALDDDEARAQIVSIITARLAGNEARVTAAFADDWRPVRSCALALMRAGRLDLETWLRARAAADADAKIASG